MSLNSLKIAIIGAGPAGCALARILSQSTASSSLSVTIFEGETSLDVRSQGGTLDVHQDSGLAALRAANLMAEFDKHARYDGDSMVMCDKYFNKYIVSTADKNNKSVDRPEIDRSRLRRLLIDSLPSGTIQWGKRVSEVETSGPSGAPTLHFRDGTSATDFDLVVGADGTWSKVRPVVTHTQPTFSGICGYSVTIRHANSVAPAVVKLMNGGNVFALHDHQLVSLQQMGDDTMQVTLQWKPAGNSAGKGDERWMDKLGFDNCDFDRVREFLLTERLAGWEPRLREALERATAKDAVARPYSLFDLPVGHSWEHRAGVTLMGDAAHVTYFGGEGVNQALVDAKVLADEIVGAVGEGEKAEREALRAALDAAVRRYELEMVKRMTVMASMSRIFGEYFFYVPGGLYENVADMLMARIELDLPAPARALTRPLVGAMVRTYFFFVKLWIRARP